MKLPHTENWLSLPQPNKANQVYMRQDSGSAHTSGENIFFLQTCGNTAPPVLFWKAWGCVLFWKLQLQVLIQHEADSVSLAAGATLMFTSLTYWPFNQACPTAAAHSQCPGTEAGSAGTSCPGLGGRSARPGSGSAPWRRRPTSWERWERWAGRAGGRRWRRAPRPNLDNKTMKPHTGQRSKVKGRRDQSELYFGLIS